MQLSNFNVVHARGDASPSLGDPLVHCHTGNQLVLVYVSTQALMDYFQVPGDRRITLAQWNLVVERNLEALKSIIDAKYVADDWEVYNAYGSSYPRLVLTLEDLRRSCENLTIKVLNIAGLWR